MRVVSTLLISMALAGCTIVDEELRVMDGLVTLRVEANKPKVRVATGIEACKWRGRASLAKDNYEVWLQCSIPFTL